MRVDPPSDVLVWTEVGAVARDQLVEGELGHG
jgi:hypothetical protein